MLNLDRLDARLIALLTGDARAGITTLSTALGVARNTVQARLRRLTESGVLQGYRPEIDLTAAGITVQAFLGLEIVQERLRSVTDALSAIPWVLEIHATTGREDLLVRVATTDHSRLQKAIEEILALPGVVHSNTTLALTTPLHYRVAPLLDALTTDQGVGRATPRPEVADRSTRR